MQRPAWLLAFLLFALGAAHAQWGIEDSNTTADLRGIFNVGGGVAWASGSNGTVLRTEDGGYVWQNCAIPPGAEHLDFRGVQAFDANTAIVMSSGKGDLSRLYKTTDGCHTWKLVARNPDPEGFWDAVQAGDPESGENNDREADRALLLGDSVNGELRVFEWKEGGEERELELSYQMRGKSETGEGSFAASNSVLQIAGTRQVDPTWKYAFRFASGTSAQSFISIVRDEKTATCEPCREERLRVEIPMAQNTDSSGVFSFDFRTDLIGVAVGGDYKKPDSTVRTAVSSADGGQTWKRAQTPPHGFRSAVAYDAASKTWITVGPNGTDISTDDGRNWRALHPDAALHEAPDADKNWNALSLPFVVGPHGRIGKLNEKALDAAKTGK
ncbi:MAG TPA: hypothetical protein VGG45_13945 [Terracidiphilus sp.]|jgi:photosystem II stability/assembly factor-like uncharacterized protein